MNAPTHLLDCIEIETAPNPTHAVIWLHGLGADGNDFAPIVPELDLPAGVIGALRLPETRRLQRVTINNGMAMRSWYDILVMDLVRVEDGRGIRASESRDPQADSARERPAASRPRTSCWPAFRKAAP